jgi:hypothetical protein
MRRLTLDQFAYKAVPYLLELFPILKPLLQTPAQIDLWYRKCGHVTLDAFVRAADEYSTEHDKRPTIAALLAYLPSGAASTKCEHVWETFERDGQVVFASCGHCGEHRPGICRCVKCECAHAHAEPDGQREGVWWYWCPDCRHALRRQQPLPASRGGIG